jgi:hypothetical protein
MNRQAVFGLIGLLLCVFFFGEQPQGCAQTTADLPKATWQNARCIPGVDCSACILLYWNGVCYSNQCNASTPFKTCSQGDMECFQLKTPVIIPCMNCVDWVCPKGVDGMGNVTCTAGGACACGAPGGRRWGNWNTWASCT